MALYSADEQLVCRRATAQAIGEHLRGIYDAAVPQAIPSHWAALLQELASREENPGQHRTSPASAIDTSC